VKKIRIPKLAKTEKVAAEIKSTTKKRNPIKNLGKYAHAAKLPTGAAIGRKSNAVTTKRRLTKTKAQYGVHDV
jgi:hypothetical protein